MCVHAQQILISSHSIGCWTSFALINGDWVWLVAPRALYNIHIREENPVFVFFFFTCFTSSFDSLNSPILWSAIAPQYACAVTGKIFITQKDFSDFSFFSSLLIFSFFSSAHSEKFPNFFFPSAPISIELKTKFEWQSSQSSHIERRTSIARVISGALLRWALTVV